MFWHLHEKFPQKKNFRSHKSFIIFFRLKPTHYTCLAWIGNYHEPDHFSPLLPWRIHISRDLWPFWLEYACFLPGKFVIKCVQLGQTKQKNLLEGENFIIWSKKRQIMTTHSISDFRYFFLLLTNVYFRVLLNYNLAIFKNKKKILALDKFLSWLRNTTKNICRSLKFIVCPKFLIYQDKSLRMLRPLLLLFLVISTSSASKIVGGTEISIEERPFQIALLYQGIIYLGYFAMSSSICETTERLLKGYWETTEKLLKNYWEATERLLRDYWEATERLLRGYWEATERLLRGYCKDIERLLRNY